MTNASMTIHSEDKKQVYVSSMEGEQGINWGGAGSVIAVSTQEGIFLPFGLRNETAPVFKTQLGTASGNIDESDSEINPKYTAVRESSEEILIYDNKRDLWVIPQLGDTELDGIAKTAVTETSTQLRDKMNYNTTSEFHTVPSERFELSETETVFESGSGTNTVSGLVVSEPRRKTTDYLDLLVVDYSNQSIQDLTFFDGELLESPTPTRQREIYLFTFEQFRNILHQPVTIERIYRYGELYSTEHKTETTREYSNGYRFTEILPLYYLVGKSHSRVCEVIEKKLQLSD